MPGRVVTWLSALLVLAAACSAPSSYEQFVKTADADSCGRYRFVLDMSDSLAVYDISLYTRLDIGRKDFQKMGDIPVTVQIVSPTGKEYEEKVYLPKAAFGGKSHLTKDCDVLYRKGAVPSAFGKWELFLSVDGDRAPGLRGMGVRLERR